MSSVRPDSVNMTCNQIEKQPTSRDLTPKSPNIMNLVNLIQSTKNNPGHLVRALPLAAVSDIPSVITPRESHRRVLTAIALPLAFFVAGTAQAGSSTWTVPTAYPSDSVGPWPDWNDPAHWAGSIIPNGQGDVATFNTLTDRPHSDPGAVDPWQRGPAS